MKKFRGPSRTAYTGRESGQYRLKIPEPDVTDGSPGIGFCRVGFPARITSAYFCSRNSSWQPLQDLPTAPIFDFRASTPLPATAASSLIALAYFLP